MIVVFPASLFPTRIFTPLTERESEFFLETFKVPYAYLGNYHTFKKACL